jgi:hypothetical protein
MRHETLGVNRAAFTVRPSGILATQRMNNVPVLKAGMTQRERAWRGNRIAFGCKHQKEINVRVPRAVELAVTKYSLRARDVVRS